MIDMHCHLLPGIDDGPPDLDTALEMARMAIADGIGFVVATPHIDPRRWHNDLWTISTAFDAFKEALDRAAIPLRVSMGSEVRLDLDVIPMLGREEIPFVGVAGGYDVVLLELPPKYVPVGAGRFIERLVRQRIRPLLAHPERNEEIIDDPGRLEPLLAAGSFLQIDAGSLTGEFGRGARRRARELLRLPVLKVLATDAHDLNERRPILSAGVAAAAKIIGSDAAQALVYQNPTRIVFGKRMVRRRLDRRSLRAAGLDVGTGRFATQEEKKPGQQKPPW